MRDLGNQDYTLMTLPISFVFMKDEFWESEEAINKVESWYWTSLFGEYYRENENETCI